MFNVKLALTLDGIEIRHLNGCNREIAGEAARAFAKDAPVGSVLTISKVEIVEEKGRRVERATIVAQATRTGEGSMPAPWSAWRADINSIVGVTNASPMPFAPVKASPSPDDLRAQVEAARAENALLRASKGLPPVAAPAVQAAPEPAIAGAPVLSSLLQ
jgi:hypothetical protein